LAPLFIQIIVNTKACPTEVCEPPERDKKTGDFKYKMVGKTIEGDRTTVVVVLTSHRSLSVVTVFGG
jgi:hypothetical protein